MSMTKSQFSFLLADIQTAEREVREQAQSEYAHDDSNVFANFDRVASHLDISRERVLLTYALKHVDGIVSWVKGHKSQREDVRGRIKDLRMYMALLWGMVEDSESKIKSPLQAVIDRVNYYGVADACTDQPVTCECEDCQPTKCDGFGYPFGEQQPLFNCVLLKGHDGECEFEYGGKRYKQSEMLKNREELFGESVAAHDNDDSSAHVIITDQLTHNATKAFDTWWDAAGESVGGFTRSQALEAFQAGWESNRASMIPDGYILGKTEAKAETERRIEQAASAASETKPRHVITGICWIPSNPKAAELTCSCGYRVEQYVIGTPYLGTEYRHP